MQLHHNRLGSTEPKDSDFEYVVDVPVAGAYDLIAHVAVVNLNQQLTLAVSGAAEPVEISLPYTRGLWQFPWSLELPVGVGYDGVILPSESHPRE